jgi:hypothetical protein
MAFQHDELGVAMEVLIPLYEVAGEPRQAYYLAQIYCARSQQAGSESTALDDCHRAIELAQHALQSDLHRAQASALLQQLEDEQARLSTTQLTDISQLDAQPSDVKERTEWQASPVAEIPLDRPVLQGTHKTPAPKKRSNRVRTYWSRLKHKWLHKLKW